MNLDRLFAVMERYVAIQEKRLEFDKDKFNTTICKCDPKKEKEVKPTKKQEDSDFMAETPKEEKKVKKETKQEKKKYTLEETREACQSVISSDPENGLAKVTKTIQEVTGALKLKDVDPKDYGLIINALKGGE